MNFTSLMQHAIIRRRSVNSTQRANEIVGAMRRVVAKSGRAHKADTGSTTVRDASGFTCIQGEVMRELGYSESERFNHGSYPRVSRLLDPMREVPRLEAALMEAQGLNDAGVEWGFILRRFEYALAA